MEEITDDYAKAIIAIVLDFCPLVPPDDVAEQVLVGVRVGLVSHAGETRRKLLEPNLN